MNQPNNVQINPDTTDYLAINAPRMARVMRGSKLAASASEFRSGTANLRHFWHLIWFMLRSMICRVPGKKTTGDKLEFAEPAAVTIHAEGECQRLERVKTIEIKKSERPLKVVRF